MTPIGSGRLRSTCYSYAEPVASTTVGHARGVEVSKKKAALPVIVERGLVGVEATS